MKFDAATFAAAWSSVWLVTGRDKGWPMLHKTVAVDWFHDRGVRLVATDGHSVATAWVPVDTDDEGPEVSEAPDEHTVVHDPDGRVAGLAEYAGARALALAVEVDPTFSGALPVDTGLYVTLGRRAVEQRQLQLVGAESPDDVTFDFAGLETVVAAVYDGQFPGWQSHVAVRLMAGTTTAQVGLEGSGLKFLVGLTAVSKKLTRVAGSCRLTFDGPEGAVVVRHDLLTPVLALVMPTREAVESQDFDLMDDYGDEVG